VMGVARDATEAQISRPIASWPRKYHPDVSKEKDAEARFQGMGETYEVVKIRKKRGRVDNWVESAAPARNSGRRRIGVPVSSSVARATATAITAVILRNLCSVELPAQPVAGDGGFEPGRGYAPRAIATPGEPGRARTITPRWSLAFGSHPGRGFRTFTLRVPEIDAEGHLISKERVLTSRYERHPAGPDHTVAGQGAGTRVRAPPATFISRSDYQPIPCIGPDDATSTSSLAGGTVGSRARRQRQDTDTGRRGRFEDSHRLARGHENALKGRAFPQPCRRSLCVLQIALPPAHGRAKRKRLPRHWPTRFPSIPVNISEYPHEIRSRCPDGKYSRNMPFSASDELSRMSPWSLHTSSNWWKKACCSVTAVEAEQWRFAGTALTRPQSMRPAEARPRDHLAGVALALELMESLTHCAANSRL